MARRTKVETWRSYRTGSDAHGLLVVGDGEVSFECDDPAESWAAPTEELSIKSPWYSFGASVRIGRHGEKGRIYMFHRPGGGTAVGNAIDAASGRRAGRAFKAALGS